jgi:hypothetical protein
MQVFADTLIALALGRDVAVPQPYALDSTGFLEVASALIEAHTAVRDASGQLPFLVHLYSQRSYRDAVASMLRRMDGVGAPFLSSILQYDIAESQGLATKAAKQIDDGAAPEIMFQLAGEHAPRLERLWRILAPWEVGHPNILQGSNEGFPNLTETLPDLANANSNVRQLLEARGLTREDDVVRLLRAIEKLHAAGGPGAFNSRSPVHAGPWPNDPERRTALQIVGDDHVLHMVRECVDTLYNARLAGTIGVPISAFSTEVVLTGGRLRRTVRAQDVALAFLDLHQPKKLLPAEHGFIDTCLGGTEKVPTFEILLDSAELNPSPEGQVSPLERLQAKATEAFAALLERRSDPKFIASHRKLQAALDDRDVDRTFYALDAHTKLVASDLGDLMTVQSGRGWVTIGWTIGTTVAGALPSAATQNWTVTTLGALAGAVAPLVREQLSRGAERRRIAEAFGEILNIGIVGGAG